jgi:hypothetical protein
MNYKNLIERSEAMKNDYSISNQNRRQFISTILPACALPYFGLKDVFTLEQEKHKFQKDFVHTYEEAFRWRFGYYINLMERFADYLGRDKLIEMIKRANDDHYKMVAENDPDFSFVKWYSEGGEIFKNMMTRTIVEKTDKALEIHVTECLWFQTFKERNATDIGYATICYSDFPSAKAAHPKVSLERTKSLMEGHDCCNHHWTWKG